jgi:hypothetical protein
MMEEVEEAEEVVVLRPDYVLKAHLSQLFLAYRNSPQPLGLQPSCPVSRVHLKK